MAYVDELLGIATGQNNANGRLYFSIFYKVKDDAFKSAALYWEQYVKRMEKFNPVQDVFLRFEVLTESEFKQAWLQVQGVAKAKRLQVAAANLLTHASKQSNGKDGLEFKGSASENGTLEVAEIRTLPRLPWAKNSYLILSGCNTGIVGTRGWCPAQVFSQTQKVHTLGQQGYAYFSKKWEQYVEKGAADTGIYLWAYKHRRNAEYLGIGSAEVRLKAKLFRAPL